MARKALTFKDAPRDYTLCFNHDCELCKKCMHYHMGRLAPDNLTRGKAIYPSALKNGNCPHFAVKRKVKFAWGFNGLYKNLTPEEASVARSALRSYLGSGVSAYYRIHNGEKLISPARQKEILDFMSKYIKTRGLRFDHYVLQYDFT